MKGILSKKIGMTQIYNEVGDLIPVTVLSVEDCKIVGIRTVAKDGYSAIQLGIGVKRLKNSSKPIMGNVRMAGYDVSSPARIKEIRLESDPQVKIGDQITVDLFKQGEFIDVIGSTKGRGFQGAVRRHHFSGGRASHGGGWLRRTGSIGMKEHPGRVYPGRKMPGHMGNVQRTVQNLEIIQIRKEDQMLLVKGAIPGPNGGFILVKQSVKKSHGK